MAEDNVLSLAELNLLVKQSIKSCLPYTYWVQAELSDVRPNYSGHCYLEFIQKDSRGNALVAKARGTIWNNIYCMLKPYFEQETGQTFAAGLKVLVKVTVEFHELYGYSLTVLDIDPTYTLGDMARRRREILKMLEEDGIIDLNKELDIPVLAQRVAVISSATAAGYGDFCNQLKDNPYGFVFYTRLFPAVMQGDRVESSIISALDKINENLNDWDVVVIIRGGGATSDLSGFDTYELAVNCAQFPLPIITGIGHERDDTVLDLISNTRVKTPTAAAEFLINRMHDTSVQLDGYSVSLNDAIGNIINDENFRMTRIIEHIPLNIDRRIKEENFRYHKISSRLSLSFNTRKLNEEHTLQLILKRLVNVTAANLENKRHFLDLTAQTLKASSPQEIMKKGYSITLKDGKPVRSMKEVKAGDNIMTVLYDGEINSIVTKK